jgi:muramoyltetrapeptide carboxypeptidase
MGSPPFLKPGDKIGIVSPSGKIEQGKLDNSIGIFREWGLNVVTGDNVYSCYNQFGGSDEQRASDLQSMLDDKSVKAIICSRGGYGTVRIIDRIDFSRFVENPKWIVGYSDITVLHSHINNLFGIETIHSPMAAEWPRAGKNPRVDCHCNF